MNRMFSASPFFITLNPPSIAPTVNALVATPTFIPCSACPGTLPLTLNYKSVGGSQRNSHITPVSSHSDTSKN